MPKLISIKDEPELKKNNIMVRPGTLYVWHSIKKHPEIFIKVGGKLFVDANKWEGIITEAIEKRDKEIAGLKKRNVI